MDQVILSPHFAFYTREAYERLEADCLEKIRLLTEGKLPRDVKNADLLANAAGQLHRVVRSTALSE
mgnify:CR=1 FL=1